MSQPILGYPDWVRSFATSRFFDVPFFATNIVAPVLTGVYTTANIDSIGFLLRADANHGHITINWYQDEAATLLTTVDIVALRNGQTWDQSIVVKGPFMRIEVAPGSVGNWTLTLILYETTRSVVSQLTSVRNLLIGNLAQNVGAGATVTLTPTNVIAGEAVWHATSALATWQAILEAIDDFGAVTHMDFQTPGSAIAPRLTFLPSRTVQIRLLNTTGAAGTFSIRLVAKPGLSGM